MSIREGNRGFWGLVQQKGPWKTTQLDVMHSQTSKGYGGNHDRVSRPFTTDVMPSLPGPSKYAQRSIIYNQPNKPLDPLSFRQGELQKGLLKAYGLDEQMALYPMGGNFSREGSILDAYEKPTAMDIKADNEAKAESMYDILGTGNAPVGGTQPLITHTDVLDMISSPGNMDLDITQPVPVFNGNDQYNEMQVTPQPGLAPEHRQKLTVDTSKKPDRKPGLAPVHKQKSKKPKKPKHVKIISPLTPEQQSSTATPNPPSPPGPGESGVKRKRDEPNSPKKVSKNTHPTAGVKRKRDEPNSPKKVSKNTHPTNKRKKPHANGPVKAQKVSSKKEKMKTELKINTTNLPPSKQSSTKPEGTKAENKSKPAKESNIPNRKTRGK